MRVAQLTCVYPPYGGGIGRVARQFACLMAPEHEVTVLTPRWKRGATFTRDAGVTLEAYPPQLKWGLGAYWSGLRRRLRAFDVVHLHHPFFGAHEFIATLPATVKLVVTYHMLPEGSGLRGWLMRRDLAISEPRLARRAQLITVATRDYLDNLVRPRLGEAAHYAVLPFGVEPAFAPGEKPELLLRRHNLKPGEAVLLFVGTLDETHGFKGLPILLQALTHLAALRWKLLVIGGGRAQAQHEVLAHTLKLQRQIVFVGYVPEPELAEYYRVADVFVLPSLTTAEAFGLAVLQAMATGLPVVASRLLGVRELVRQGETGLSVPPGDPLALAAALEQLLGAPHLMQELGGRGRNLASQVYSLAAVGARLHALYQSL